MKRIGILVVAVLVGACEKVDTGVDPGDSGADMSKYVAMGTSITMGFASDGVISSSQQSSWPKLLANDVGVTFSLPLIDAPGCPPPFASPLASLKRIDNTSIISNSIVCAQNSAGVVLPTQNVAVSGHTAADAFTTAPSGASGDLLASRVLPSGQTQVTAMRSQAPTFVSVELGVNEFFPAFSGLVSTNSTITPIEAFTGAYGNIIDAVKQTGAKALLLLVPTDVAKYPAVRTGAEIAAQRSALLFLNVSVNADCDTSPNLVTVLKVLAALSNGAARASGGLGPADLSCADVPLTPDGILSPAEVTTLNALAVQINTYITAKANENGYATMSLGVLYDNAKTGVPFDIAAILLSPAPFGPAISLDSVHPSAIGNQILAAGAKAAIIAKYGAITK